jgi:hypothetical protein
MTLTTFGTTPEARVAEAYGRLIIWFSSVLGKIIRDREPRRFRANKDVRFRRIARIVIETPHWDHDGPPRFVQEGKARAAFSAEDMREPLRFGQLEALHQVFTGGETDRFESHEEIRSERSSVDLATSLTMTIVGPNWRFSQLESNGPAKAASFDHLNLPFVQT